MRDRSGDVRGIGAMPVAPPHQHHAAPAGAGLRQRRAKGVAASVLLLVLIAAAGLPAAQGLVGLATVPFRMGGSVLARRAPSRHPRVDGRGSARRLPMRISGGGGELEAHRGVPWGVVYGLGFGAITAARICVEAHLQGFYMRVIGLAPAIVGPGWSIMCLLVALAEPFIGLTIDKIKNSGVRITSVLRLAMIPWIVLLYFVWLPSKASPILLFTPVVLLSLLQAGLNLGFLSIYPSLFPTPEARSKAIVPQQGMVVAGLLMGMTLPAILSSDWSIPGAFSLRFSIGVGVCLATSIALLCFWEASQVASGAAKRAAADKGVKARTASFAAFGEIVQDRRMARVMASVFLAQVGNALLSSSLPLFCREVVDLSQPIGPFFGGAIPALSSHWQFSSCFAIFYLLGGVTAGWWARLATRIGTVGALQTAMRSYAGGCITLALGPGGLVTALTPFIAASALNKFLVLLACYAVNGLSLGGLVSLPDVVLAEGVKELEGDGGEGKAGKVYGAKQLVYRLGSALQGLVTAAVLAGFGGSWRVALPVLAGLLPAVCYVAAAAVLPETRPQSVPKAT